MKTAAKRSLRTTQWQLMRSAGVDNAETDYDSTTSILAALPANAFPVQGSVGVRMRFIGRPDGVIGNFHLYGFNYRQALDSKTFDVQPAYFVTQICTFDVSTGATVTLEETFLEPNINLIDQITITSTGGAAYERLFKDSANSIVDSWEETDGWSELVVVNPGFQWMYVQFTVLEDLLAVNGLWSLIVEDRS